MSLWQGNGERTRIIVKSPSILVGGKRSKTATTASFLFLREYGSIQATRLLELRRTRVFHDLIQLYLTYSSLDSCLYSIRFIPIREAQRTSAVFLSNFLSDHSHITRDYFIFPSTLLKLFEIVCPSRRNLKMRNF